MRQPFPRHLFLAAAAATVTITTLTGIAYSDDGTAAALGPFDIADSHGIRISQYQLSIDQGGITDLGKGLQSQALTGVWDLYRMLIGFIAYVTDWVVGMTWITWITGPVDTAARSIHDSLLVPLHMDRLGTGGLMGFLVVVAGAIITIHFIRGNTGRALGETLVSAIVTAAVVGLLAAPVVTFAGTSTEPAAPVRVAQRLGLEISNLILAKPLSDASMESTLDPNQRPIAETVQPVKTGSLLVDTFIRPVHQLVNYGTVLDTAETRCVDAYDTALKAGPSDDPDKARSTVGRCDQQLQDYAESSSWLRVVGLNLYVITAGLLALLVLVFAALLVFAVITLTWASLKLIVHAPLAIIPGDTRGPGIRDLVDIAISLLYVVGGLAALSVVIKLVNTTLTDTRAVPLQVRFVGIDLILTAGFALLIVNYVAHRRGARSLGDRIMSRLRQSPTRNTSGLGQKAARWLTQPSFAATNLGGAPLAMRNGSQLARRPLNRVTASNGVRIAAAVGGIALGGAGLGVKALSLTGKTAVGAGQLGVRASQAGSRAAVHAARETSKAWRVHQSLRSGSQRPTTGHTRLDHVLTHTARAHQYLADQGARGITAATTSAVLGAGPHTRPASVPPLHVVTAAPADPRRQPPSGPRPDDDPGPRPKPAKRPAASIIHAAGGARPTSWPGGPHRTRTQTARDLLTPPAPPSVGHRDPAPAARRSTRTRPRPPA